MEGLNGFLWHGKRTVQITPPPPTVWVPPTQRAQSPCSSVYLEVHVLMKVISSMDKRAVFIVRTARAVGSGCSACRVVFQTEVGRPIILVALEACCCLITGCCKVGTTGVSDSSICICEARKLNF